MMELIETITDTLALVHLEVVDKIDRGGGLEGYYVLKVIPEKGAAIGWKDREIAAFDEFFYTNSEFIRKGFKVKGALKLLGGYMGERVKPGERVFDQRSMDREWEGYAVQGPIVHEAYLGPVVDIGIPIHCHYLLASNVPLLEKWKKERTGPYPQGLDIPKKGDWVKVTGGLYIYLLKELELFCMACGEGKKYLTTSLPTADELSNLISVCRKCKHEQPANAFPDICGECKKKMWQWKGKNVAFPLECKCGKSRFDFTYDHMPQFIEG